MPAASLPLSVAAYPPLQQRISHGEHDGTDEQADDSEGDQPADDAADDQQQRQVDTATDQDRPQEVVHDADRNAPDEKRECPTDARVAKHPDHRRYQHRERPELRDAEHEDRRGQQAGVRHAADPQAQAGECRLHERGNDHS
jgi:hypothetical protein